MKNDQNIEEYDIGRYNFQWKMNLGHIFLLLVSLEPQVEVFQESPKTKGEKMKAGVGLQMKKCVSDYWSIIIISLNDDHIFGVE